ncbi:hypothetical protein [Evansella clarkii]|uniref:hypothetical protein n=1 Tax=Evansella clarkii TaxID=79879 RepID=UPI000B435665|nr:hypothetical protein [Evansella clarkii]
MRMRSKAAFIFIVSVLTIFAVFACIDTVSPHSQTVDKAFEKFIKSEHKMEAAQSEIGEKVYYQNGDYTFILFEIGAEVSLVQFEQGIFGWVWTSFSRDRNEGYSYSAAVDYLNGESLLHGTIPKDIVAETRTITVNGAEADIVMLNDKTGIWIMVNAPYPEDIDDFKIEFLDEGGNLIAQM